MSVQSVAFFAGSARGPAEYRFAMPPAQLLFRVHLQYHIPSPFHIVPSRSVRMQLPCPVPIGVTQSRFQDFLSGCPHASRSFRVHLQSHTVFNIQHCISQSVSMHQPCPCVRYMRPSDHRRVACCTALRITSLPPGDMLLPLPRTIVTVERS
jgi:hypothetical protein